MIDLFRNGIICFAVLVFRPVLCQETVVNRVPGVHSWVSINENKDLDFGFLRASGRTSEGQEAVNYILREDGQLSPWREKFPVLADVDYFQPLVDPVSGSFFQFGFDGVCKQFLFSKDLQPKDFNLECTKVELLRFFNHHVFLSEDSVIRKIDVRQFDLQGDEKISVDPSYKTISIHDSIVFLQSFLDSQIIVKNYQNQVLARKKFNTGGLLWLHSTSFGVYFAELGQNSASLWFMDKKGAKFLQKFSEENEAFTNSSSLLLIYADSIVSFNGDKKAIKYLSGDKDLLFGSFNGLSSSIIQGERYIFGDSVLLVERTNFYRDTIVRNSLESGFYILNLRSGIVKKIIQSHNIPAFFTEFTEFKGRLFSVSSTWRNCKQVVEIDLTSGRLIIRSDFKAGLYKTRLAVVKDNLFCITSLEKSGMHNIWRIDPNYSYGERENHWASALVSMNRDVSSIGSLSYSSAVDLHGNMYTLFHKEVDDPYFYFNSKEKKMRIFEQEKTDSSEMNGNIVLQKFKKDGSVAWTKLFSSGYVFYKGFNADSEVKTDKNGRIFVALNAGGVLKVGSYGFDFLSSGQVKRSGFIAKFDSAGRFLDLFPKAFTSNTRMSAFDLGEKGSMYCALEANGTFDFQGHTIFGQGSEDIRSVIKLDSTGKVLWSRNIPMPKDSFAAGNIEKIIWDAPTNLVLVLVNGLAINSFVQQQSSPSRVFGKLVALNSATGKEVWTRLFSSENEIRMMDMVVTKYRSVNLVGSYKKNIYSDCFKLLVSDSENDQGFFARVSLDGGDIQSVGRFHRENSVPLKVCSDEEGNIFTSSLSPIDLQLHDNSLQRIVYDYFNPNWAPVSSFGYFKRARTSIFFNFNATIPPSIAAAGDRKLLVGDNFASTSSEGFSFNSLFPRASNLAVFHLLDFKKLQGSDPLFDKKEDELLVYPNPSGLWFFFFSPGLKSAEICDIKLFSTAGRLVFQSSIPVHEGQVQLNPGSLAPAVYHGVLTTPEGFSRRFKVIKTF